MSRYKPRVMGVHASTKGMGFAVFEGGAIYDWGTVVMHGDKNAMALRKLGRLIDRFSPEVLVVEELGRAPNRADRTRKLYVAIGALCAVRGVAFTSKSKAEVCFAFELDRSSTRQEVAEAVAFHVGALAPRLPWPRKPWQSESRRMAIFVAASVAMAYLATHDISAETR